MRTSSSSSNCVEEGVEETTKLAADLIALVASQYTHDLAATLQRVEVLYQEAAGLKRGPTGDNGRRRLQHPELKTTYPETCTRALVAKRAEYRRKLASVLTDATMLTLQLLAIEGDIADFEALQQQSEQKMAVRKTIGLYPAAAKAVDLLFEGHGVTHHHWRAAREDQIKRIAAILGERPASVEEA